MSPTTGTHCMSLSCLIRSSLRKDGNKCRMLSIYSIFSMTLGHSSKAAAPIFPDRSEKESKPYFERFFLSSVSSVVSR